MRPLVPAIGLAVLASLGCGPVFCVDRDQCFDGVPTEPDFDFDSGTGRDPAGIGLVDAFADCGDVLHVLAVTEGTTWGGALTIWEGSPLESTGEGHPLTWTSEDGWKHTTELFLQPVDHTEAPEPGRTTWVRCESIDTVTFALRADGDFVENWCWAWGARAGEAADATGCTAR
jgi:hypothetical protein